MYYLTTYLVDYCIFDHKSKRCYNQVTDVIVGSNIKICRVIVKFDLHGEIQMKTDLHYQIHMKLDLHGDILMNLKLKV